MPKQYLLFIIGLLGIVPLIFVFYLIRKISKKNSSVVNMTEIESKKPRKLYLSKM